MAKVLTVEPGNSTLKRAQKLYEADQLDEAYSAVQDVLAETPDDAQALTLAAAVLKRAEKTPVAYHLARRATELRPDRSETWVAFGHCAQHLWRLEEAEAAYMKALETTDLDKQKATYLNNLASISLDSGDFRKSEIQAKESLKYRDDPLTRHNLGLSYLGQQRFREGWREYTHSVGTFNRLNIKYRSPEDEEPVWSGEKGQKVVVYGEQGLGDEISFASVLPDVIRDSKKVVIDCDARLEGLFRRSFPEAKVYGTRFNKKVAWDEEDIYPDASISIGEICKFYRNEIEDFPGTPYLVPCPDRAAGWREVFRSKEKPVIGIAWSGGTWVNGAKNRFIPLKEWSPIFEAIDAHWVSLQYKDASAEIESSPVEQYPWATLTKDYDDTAALVAACDMVICMQTAVAHLAGALGTPCWVMVPKNSQWRYGEATESIPWYNSLRIFKQKTDWTEVIERIAKALPDHFREVPRLSEVSGS